MIKNNAVRERDRNDLTVGELRDLLTQPGYTHAERAQLGAALLMPVRGTQIERRIMRTLRAPLKLDACTRFRADLALFGWDVQRLDLDLTGAHPSLMMTLTRQDHGGDLRCVTLHTSSATGRATLTREHHEAAVTRTGERYAKIHLLGRTTHEGAWTALRALAAYVADNARCHQDVRRADRLAPFRDLAGALRSEVG